MNRFVIAVLCVSMFGCTTVRAAEAPKTETPAKAAEAPKTETPAKAAEAPKTETPAKKAEEVKERVTTHTFKGRDGVAIFLEAASSDTLPAGTIVLEANPRERIEGALDTLEEADASQAGVKQASNALLMAAKELRNAPDNQKAAWAQTTAVTYEAWVAAANGTDEVRVKAWTTTVASYAAAGDASGLQDSIDAHASSERRVERLVNPGWAAQVVRWWNRPSK